MEDTSFAIHPGKASRASSAAYTQSGAIMHIARGGQMVTMTCERGGLRIAVITDDIVRISYDPNGVPATKTSPAVVGTKKKATVHLEEAENELRLQTAALAVTIEKPTGRLSIRDRDGRLLIADHALGFGADAEGHIHAHHVLHEADHFYGLGEKTGFLDKRGTKTTMWNTDVYAPHNPEIEALYQSIPFLLTLRKGRAHGCFFDNPNKSYLDLRTEKDYIHYEAEGGMLDYYVFSGPTPKDVIRQYTFLTGRMPLPPKWALGYHQSRYSYMSENEVRELVAAFQKQGIPLDAVYLDIHYMKGYRVFTFDPERFPNPHQLIRDLKNEGIHVVPIVDPGVKTDPEYPVYREGVLGGHFCKTLEGDVYHGEVWPGDSVFPDFASAKTREWWGEKHRFYTDLGIDGIWNDMNEPAVFNETKTMAPDVVHDCDGELKTHREFHNLYGLMMSQATYEGLKQQLDGQRPFVLTRAGFAGIQRYAAVWTGDNRSFWEHLEMALPMLMNLGLSGVAFCGADVGGFAHDSDGELLARWTQAGAFSPFFRNHSALGFLRQEPWAFGEPYTTIVKKYIRLRYRFLPYLYTLFREASETGVPVMRPLFLEYPDDEKTYPLHDQFLIGRDVLVAPVLRPAANHRAVYFPEGEWIDYWSGRLITGGGHQLIEAPLDTLPLFIRRGAILPQAPVAANTGQAVDKLIVHFYLAERKEKATIYDDDGRTFRYQTGASLNYEIGYSYDGQIVKIELDKKPDHFQPTWTALDLHLHLAKPDAQVLINGAVAETVDDHGVKVVRSIPL